MYPWIYLLQPEIIFKHQLKFAKICELNGHCTFLKLEIVPALLDRDLDFTCKTKIAYTLYFMFRLCITTFVFLSQKVPLLSANKFLLKNNQFGYMKIHNFS
jgi:integrase